MFRGVLAIIGGVMASFWLTIGLIRLGSQLYPPPTWLDINKPETLLEAIRTAPTGLLVFLLFAYSLATFVGAGIASRIAHEAKIRHGMMVGALLLVLNLSQNLGLPYPRWFKIAGALVFLPMAFLGARLVTLAPTEKPESIDDLSDPELV
jgi:hypothetical protein